VGIAYSGEGRHGANAQAAFLKQSRQLVCERVARPAAFHWLSIWAGADGLLDGGNMLCYAVHMDSGTRNSHAQMCELVKKVGGSVQLDRAAGSWGLQVTLPPAAHRCGGWRAAGFLFSEIDDVEVHAQLLLLWLDGFEIQAGIT
jgi:hypothetical protein